MINDRYGVRPQSSLSLFVPDRNGHSTFSRYFKPPIPSIPKPSRTPDGDDSRVPRTIRLARPDPSGVRRCSRPIADPDVLAARIFLSSAPAHCQNVTLEELPPLPTINTPSFPDAFLAKLHQCSVRCHWENAQVELRAKEIKLNALKEILKICEVLGSFRRLSETIGLAIIDVIGENVHRQVKLLPKTLQISDELPVLHDPEWAHLSLVYEILRHVHSFSPQSPGFTMLFFKKVVNQIGTPDGREGDQICAFAVDFASSRARLLPAILDALAAALLDYCDSGNLVFAVNCVLTIYLSIVRSVGSSVNAVKKFFYSTTLPHLTSISFSAFSRPFLSVLQAYVGLHPRASVTVIHQITQYWPHTHSAKQVPFLRMFAIALPHAFQRSTPHIISRVFPIIAECISSPVQQVSEIAIALLAEPPVVIFMQQNASSIVPIILPAVSRANNSHWAPEVRAAAHAAAMSLPRPGPRVQKDAQPEKEAPGPVWAQIVHTVHKAGEAINVSLLLSQIMSTHGIARDAHDAQPHRRQSAVAKPLMFDKA
jgi:serine/threonine-protein phosphatase 2A regulatory subunit B'